MGTEKPTAGEIWKTPSLKTAYMSQDVFDLDENKTVFELGNNYSNEKKRINSSHGLSGDSRTGPETCHPT